MDVWSLALAGLAMLLGGILKGAVGAGAPVVAVPILALLFDVPFAVALLVGPNLVTNVVQGFQYRKSLVAPRFALIYAVAGGVGAGIGSFMLAWLPSNALMLVVAVSVLGYIIFRGLRPDWRLTQTAADKLVGPAGVLAGILQGSVGISAPVSITFLNALKLDRPVFIATISIFFCAMSLVQIPVLLGLGILTQHILLLGLLTLVPLLGGMRIGDWLARRIRPAVFDKIIMALLTVIAVRLIWRALA